MFYLSFHFLRLHLQLDIRLRRDFFYLTTLVVFISRCTLRDAEFEDLVFIPLAICVPTSCSIACHNSVPTPMRNRNFERGPGKICENERTLKKRNEGIFYCEQFGTLEKGKALRGHTNKVKKSTLYSLVLNKRNTILELCSRKEFFFQIGHKQTSSSEARFKPVKAWREFGENHAALFMFYVFVG